MTIKNLLFFLIALSFTTCSQQKTSTVDRIETELSKLDDLKMMQKGEKYNVFTNGKDTCGRKEDFLRKRKPIEIIESKLSTGCGDYSMVFYYLMTTNHNVECKFLDAAEISTWNYDNYLAGHTGVVVMDKPKNRWILVDPTKRKIISKNWSLDKKIYQKKYWIGYLGSLSNYPVRSFKELREFYKETLKTVPEDKIRKLIK